MKSIWDKLSLNNLQIKEIVYPNFIVLENDIL